MRSLILLLCVALAGAVPAVQSPPLAEALDKVAAKWVEDTFKKMTLDDKVGQLVVSSFSATYLASDGETFQALAEKVKQLRLGGFHVFGGAEPVPAALLADHYGSVTLGQPLAAASTLNRLQSLSLLPLLNTADFESGAGFRIAGPAIVEEPDSTTWIPVGFAAEVHPTSCLVLTQTPEGSR